LLEQSTIMSMRKLSGYRNSNLSITLLFLLLEFQGGHLTLQNPSHNFIVCECIYNLKLAKASTYKSL
jgi:hypothetical protein